MMAAIALRRDGWKIVYLGADTPLQDTFALAERVGARVVGISITASERVASLERELKRERRPGDLSLVLGGAGTNRTAARRVGAVYAVPDLPGAVHTMRALSA